MKKHMLLYTTMLLIGWSGTSLSANPSPQPKDHPSLPAMVRYLNELTTLKAKFVQTSAGEVAQGHVVLSLSPRSSKIQMMYETPHPKIVSSVDEQKIVQVDLSSGDHMVSSSKNKPFKMFLRRPFVLDKKIHVEEVISHEGILKVTLLHADPFDGQKLVLVFNEEPLQLREWHIVEPKQEAPICVVLSHIQENISLDDQAFTLPPASETIDVQNLKLR